MSFRKVLFVFISIITLNLGVVPLSDQSPLISMPQALAWDSAALIIDHTSTDITAIPESAILKAKNSLHIAYGHTSHGSQLESGMTGLVEFANGGGKGLNLPQDIFAWNNGGTGGALDLHDCAMSLDVGYYPDWVNNTRNYLGAPDPVTGRGSGANADVNVIIWSWCGQAGSRTEQSMIDTYLAPMSQLEVDYPGITFVYMTGHLDGGGAAGNLNQRNEQIRRYCRENNKVLYDFADIESYDPDGLVNYMELWGNDECWYDSNGDNNRDSNWATAWQNSHTEGVDWYSCSSAHSEPLNANMKAYAAWQLWARLAGWGGNSSDTTAPSVPTELTGTAASQTAINLTWTASSDNVAVAGYRVYRNGMEIATSTTTSYSDSGLTASTQYAYTVAAYDAAGNASAQCPAVNATTQSAPVNHAPVLSAIDNRSVNEGAELTITVSATDSDGDTLTYSAENLPQGASFNATTRVFSWTPGYDAAGSYLVVFRVTDGVATDREVITITVNDVSSQDTIPPSVPEGLIATATSHDVTLEWAASTDNVGVTGYNIYRDGTLIGTAAATAYTDRTAVPSTGYAYTVSAYDEAGCISAQSTVLEVTVQAESDDSMLYGVTPANYAPVAGWRPLCVQDWEGSEPGAPGDTCLTGDSVWTYSDMSVRDSYAHTGTKSLRSGEYGSGRNGSNGHGRERFIVQVPAGSSEVYVSWYERLDAFDNGVGNYFAGADFYTVNFVPTTAIAQQMTLNFSGCGWGVGEDVQQNGVFGYNTGWLVWQPQGVDYERTNPNGLLGINNTFFGFDGLWHQWEVHYKGNTPGVDNADGVLEVWRDGELWNRYANVNLNGIADMTGMKIELSGWWGNYLPFPRMTEDIVPAEYRGGQGYPLQEWANALINEYLATGRRSPYLECGTYIGEGFGSDTSPTGLSFDEANDLCPGTAPSHTFYKYIDDVVILYKSDTTGDVLAPTTPTGLTVVSAGSNQVSLTWTASTDNVGVSGYRVYRNGAPAGTSAATTYSDTGLSAGTTYSYTVLAYDAAANVSAQCAAVNVTTQAPIPNRPPVLASIGNRSVNEGVLLEFTVSASDPDLDTLAFSASGLPSGAQFNANTMVFSWTPDYAQSGSYQVTFNVSDGRGGTDSETIPITVNNVNRAAGAESESSAPSSSEEGGVGSCFIATAAYGTSSEP
jgi:chitodextrinase